MSSSETKALHLGEGKLRPGEPLPRGKGLVRLRVGLQESSNGITGSPRGAISLPS